MKTAITVDATPRSWCDTTSTIHDINNPRKERAKLPNNFVAEDCFAVPDREISLRIEDAEGALLDVHSSAFQFGPLAFWRKPFGFIYVVTYLYNYPSIIYPFIVTIRGYIK